MLHHWYFLKILYTYHNSERKVVIFSLRKAAMQSIFEFQASFLFQKQIAWFMSAHQSCWWPWYIWTVWCCSSGELLNELCYLGSYSRPVRESPAKGTITFTIRTLLKIASISLYEFWQRIFKSLSSSGLLRTLLCLLDQLVWLII